MGATRGHLVVLCYKGSCVIGYSGDSLLTCVLPPPQRRVLKAWLAAQQRSGSAQCTDTEARLLQLGVVDESEGEEDEEEEEGSSEPQEDSDMQLSDSGDAGPRRGTGRYRHGNGDADLWVVLQTRTWRNMISWFLGGGALPG